MKPDFTDLFLIELNEINFEFVELYAAQGKLPNLARLIALHGITHTTSEDEYDHLEPWIQWITAHTGKSYAEHQVFRLGDITKHEIPQIWEFLESHGLNVGAVSPMNANNRLKNPAFFVPDPWTETKSSGGVFLRGLSDAAAQAVNDNAQSRITPKSAFWLFAGAARYARLSNYGVYLSLVWGALKKKSWAKAQFLDQLLADVMVCETRAKEPQFVSLFLNAGAHIQHHYMFNSKVYAGQQRNPDWLLNRDDDPIFDIYNQYDRTIGQIIQAFPKARLIIATGLHQDPFEEEKYYWRLKDHDSFLRQIDVPFKSVEPRMSRDFLVECHDAEEAIKAQRILEQAASEDGRKLFDVDNRGSSLFVMLTYPADIPLGMNIVVGNRQIENFSGHVAFVAIKNGEHNGIGYLIDTGNSEPEQNVIQLSSLPSMIAGAFGLDWNAQTNLKTV
jgi:hypothetical protein